jgi:hypothetical protein
MLHFCIVAIFVSVGVIKNISSRICMIRTKFHVPSLIGSLIIALRLRAKCRFHCVFMFLSYILQKIKRLYQAKKIQDH